MTINAEQFYKMRKKNPKTELVVNRIVLFEDRCDMVLITFGGSNYEIWLPPNSLMEYWNE